MATAPIVAPAVAAPEQTVGDRVVSRFGPRPLVRARPGWDGCDSEQRVGAADCRNAHAARQPGNLFVSARIHEKSRAAAPIAAPRSPAAVDVLMS